MSKKLTLRLDETVIERAKEYASRRDTSVSQLVEDYFARLTKEGAKDAKESFPDSLGPMTGRLVQRTPTSDAEEADYYDYLEEKHR